MRSQRHGQRKSLTVHLNSRPVRRIELYTKVWTNRLLICFNEILLHLVLQSEQDSESLT